MGCWNGTCGVTHYPIVHGEPVALFFLTRTTQFWNDYHGGHCYANTLWNPRTLPIYGAYDDYGRIEGYEEDWNTKFIVNSFHKDIIEKEVGKNEYHDIAVKRTDLNIEFLMEAVHESRIEVKRCKFRSDDADRQPVGYMMIHKAVYMEFGSHFESMWDNRVTLEHVLAEARQLHPIIAEKCNEVPSFHDDPKMRSLAEVFFTPHMMFGDALRKLHKDKSWHSVFSAADNVDSVYTPVGIKSYFELLISKIRKGKSFADIEPIWTELGRFLIFHGNFQHLRRTWMPQSGAGSQADPWDLYNRLRGVESALIENMWARGPGFEDDEEE